MINVIGLKDYEIDVYNQSTKFLFNARDNQYLTHTLLIKLNDKNVCDDISRVNDIINFIRLMCEDMLHRNQYRMTQIDMIANNTFRLFIQGTHTYGV